jgi:hypothetical protein
LCWFRSFRIHPMKVIKILCITLVSIKSNCTYYKSRNSFKTFMISISLEKIEPDMIDVYHKVLSWKIFKFKTIPAFGNPLLSPLLEPIISPRPQTIILLPQTKNKPFNFLSFNTYLNLIDFHSSLLTHPLRAYLILFPNRIILSSIFSTKTCLSSTRFCVITISCSFTSQTVNNFLTRSPISRRIVSRFDL